MTRFPRTRQSSPRRFPLPCCECRWVPRDALASRVEGAAGALRSACGPSNGKWSRTASQACATRRRTEFQACDGEWRRREVHASVSGRGRMMIAVQIPATSNAAVTPIAMGRKPRPLPRLRRGGASSSVTSKMSGSGFRETGRRFGPAGRAGRGGCWPGRRLLHVGQTPSSPAAGVYKAPHVEHPTTESDAFMLPMVPDQG